MRSGHSHQGASRATRAPSRSPGPLARHLAGRCVLVLTATIGSGVLRQAEPAHMPAPSQLVVHLSGSDIPEESRSRALPLPAAFHWLQQKSVTAPPNGGGAPLTEADKVRLMGVQRISADCRTLQAMTEASLPGCRDNSLYRLRSHLDGPGACPGLGNGTSGGECSAAAVRSTERLVPRHGRLRTSIGCRCPGLRGRSEHVRLEAASPTRRPSPRVAARRRALDSNIDSHRTGASAAGEPNRSICASAAGENGRPGQVGRRRVLPDVVQRAPHSGRDGRPHHLAGARLPGLGPAATTTAVTEPVRGRVCVAPGRRPSGRRAARCAPAVRPGSPTRRDMGA